MLTHSLAYVSQPLEPEESSDLLPFALDESPGAGGGGGGLLQGAADSEEALGAFVRMLEQAPPLHSAPRSAVGFSDDVGFSHGGGGMRSSHMTLAAGLEQLAALRGALPPQPTALAT